MWPLLASSPVPLGFVVAPYVAFPIGKCHYILTLGRQSGSLDHCRTASRLDIVSLSLGC